MKRIRSSRRLHAVGRLLFPDKWRNAPHSINLRVFTSYLYPMRSKPSLVATTLSFALLTGCVIPTKYDPIANGTPPSTLPKNEIKPRGSKVDWGLSLSGGG